MCTLTAAMLLFHACMWGAARAQGVSSVLGEPGADLSTVLGVDFNEAITGSAATVTLDVLGPCGDCKVCVEAAAAAGR